MLETTDLPSSVAIEDEVASEAVFELGEVLVFVVAAVVVGGCGGLGLLGGSFEEAPVGEINWEVRFYHIA